MADELLVCTGGQVRRFGPDRPVRVARDKSADVPVGDPLVSREHLVLECAPAGWILRDAGSTRGTYLDGTRVVQLLVPPAPEALTVHLGAPDGPAVEIRRQPAAVPEQQAPPPRPAPAPGRITIGRVPECDLPLDDVQVSRRHAELCVEGGRAILRDTASANGTFVNGRRITERELAIGDRVGIGTTTLVWDGTRLATPGRSDDALVARHLRVATREGKVLLDDVSLSVPDRGLVAVIGPSGAGKSTLLGALTGLRPAASGTVTWRSQDLYASYDALRSRIGLVPQDDTLHPQLTVRRALAFAAKLRLPDDAAEAERAARVDAVLHDVDLVRQADQRIDSLSGGQRKRVSIALELLTAPPLLFLDEPTSGLDPGLDKQVMATMRRLADGDRVVLVVTHSVLNLEHCDRVLLLAPGGRTAFYGPPASLLPFFGASSYAEVFARLEEPGWHTRFIASPEHEQFVGGTDPVPPPALPEPPPPRTPHPWKQMRTLAHRNLAVVAADRTLLVLLLAMPLALALLARAVEGGSGLAASDELSAQEAQQRLTVLVLGGCLMGSALAIREMVKERAVYARERAVGLSPAAYLLSKAVVVAALVALEAFAFTFLALVGLPGPPQPLLLPGGLEVAVAVAAAAVALGMAGLAVSAAVRSADQTMPALVGLIMTQLVLCGGLIAVAGRSGLDQLSWLAPARFSFAAAASTVGLEPPAGTLFAESAGGWVLLLLAIGLQCAALLGLCALLLRRSVARRPL